MADPRPPRIGPRAARGFLWSYGSFAAGRLLVLASIAVIARLLSPEDFGLVALAIVFVTALDSVRDLGLSQALIVADDDELPAQAQTAFVFGVLLGAGLSVVVAAISPLAAEFFDEPELLPLVAVLGLNLLLRSLGRTHYALAQRSLDFRSRTVAEMADVVVRGAVGIALALAGLGAWSLVLGYLAGTLAWTVAMWALVPWRPALSRHREGLRPMLRFGGALTVMDIVGSAMFYIDNVFVGRVLGAASLGLYSVGVRVPLLLINSVGAVSGLVLFPAFALVDVSALRNAVLTALRYTMLLGLPLTAIVIVLADPLVLALFGEKWRDAAPVMQVLGIAALGSPISHVVGNAYKARKRVDVLLWLAVPQALLLVGAIAVFVDRGIVAVAWCQAAVRLLFLAVALYLSVRILGIRAKELWGAAWPPYLVAIGMALAMVPVERALGPSWAALLGGVTVGAAVYAVLVRVLIPGDFARLWRTLRAPSPAVVPPAPAERLGQETADLSDPVRP